MIKNVNGELRYYDKTGYEITEGCMIRYPDGRTEIVYLTENGYLGTDATNRSWIERGLAVPCEYGIYALEEEDTKEVEVV